MSNSRRAFLEKISALGALSILPFSGQASAAAAPEEAEAENQFSSGPYLQHVMPDEATIMWTASKNSFSWVEYGEGNNLSLKAFGYVGGLINANNRNNKITLRNLKPGKNYKYRIVSTEILNVKGPNYSFGEPLVSAMYIFKTPAADEQEFKAVIFNDIHDRPQTIPELLYRHGYTGNKPDFDFVVFNGDCFDWINTEEQIHQHLINPSVNVFAKETPFILTQGNHECRGAFSRNINDYFAYPEDKFYYAFTRGPVRFVILDSGEDKTDDHWEYGGLSAFDRYREVQKKWLEKEIESDDFKKAAFRVVLIHISPYHSGDWHGTLHCREMFGPLLNKGKIDLQISGHTHRYGTFNPDATHNYPIVIGGGPLQGNRTLMKLHATPKELNLQMIRDDGEVVGKYKIAKKA